MYSKKLEILRTSKFMLKIFGVNLKQTRKSLTIFQKIYHAFYLIPLTITLFASFGYFMFASRNVTEMTDSLYTAIGFILLTSWYLVFIKRRLMVRMLLMNLENFINLSKFVMMMMKLLTD